MASKLCLKRLNKEIMMYQKENFKFPNLILKPKEDNILIWYFIIYDLKETPFENGFYFGKITLPNEYPLKPPNFIFYTPNGRFETNKNICTTFSAYHQETYTSTWNILTMMEGLISFMTDIIPDKGIGYIHSTDEEKQNYAKQSQSWNSKNDEFIKIFNDQNDF
jgi:ubiquitin-conjugating enzyme E2 J2